MSNQPTNSIEIKEECCICFEEPSTFVKNQFCSHSVCSGCSVGISKCPLCRRRFLAGEEVNTQIKTYKYRCECSADAENIRETLGTNAQDYNIDDGTLDDEWVIIYEYAMPDCVVVFKSTLILTAIRKIIGKVPDSHVAVQTVQPIELYTGVRNRSV